MIVFMSDHKARYTFRLDYKLLHKGHIVAKYYGRSLNMHLDFLLRKHVAAFEQKHGKLK